MEEKPQGILISVETGQLIPVTPIQWPLEDTDTDEAITEPAEPMRFSQSFTLKLPKKQLKKVLSYYKAATKLPRKMKKACKHIKIENSIVVTERRGKSETVSGVLSHTKDGYPYTKWVRKVIGKVTENILKGKTQ